MMNIMLLNNGLHLRDDEDEYNDSEATSSSPSTPPSASSSSRFESIMRLFANNAAAQLSRYHGGNHILPPTQPFAPFPPHLFGENSRRYHHQHDEANSPEDQRRRLVETRIRMIEDALAILNDEGTTSTNDASSSSSPTLEQVQQQDDDDVDEGAN